MRRWGREVGAVLATLAVYEARVLPRARRELASWRAVAEAIPDPVLRETAVAALTDKASNVEAVAVFATLAPAARRPAVVRAIVALQAAIDYLDSLGERPGDDAMRDGLLLHGSLGTVFAAGERADWYAHHPRDADGGYLERLLAASRTAFASLPSAPALGPLAHAAALRCGEGQSYTHAAAEAPQALSAWAAERAVPGFAWWETAAGASSSVAPHALIALAAQPGVDRREAALVDVAYFPPVGALTVLLDDLVDREADRAAGEHSYLDYYSGPEEAAERLAAITVAARDAERRLPRAERHAAILAGVLSHYLAAPGSSTPYAAPIRDRLLAAGGPAVRLLTSILRLRRDD